MKRIVAQELSCKNPADYLRHEANLHVMLLLIDAKAWGGVHEHQIPDQIYAPSTRTY